MGSQNRLECDFVEVERNPKKKNVHANVHANPDVNTHADSHPNANAFSSRMSLTYY